MAASCDLLNQALLDQRSRGTDLARMWTKMADICCYGSVWTGG